MNRTSALTGCSVCGRGPRGELGGAPRCGYHLPAFSERSRRGAFVDFGARTATPTTPRRSGPGRRQTMLSLGHDDVARLEALVDEARRLGVRRASKSSVVRWALSTVDVAAMPRDGF